MTDTRTDPPPRGSPVAPDAGRKASRSPHVEWWAQEKWPTSDEWDYARPFTTYDDGAAWVVAMREKFPDGKFRLAERRITEEITHA